ncbi:hypothetical protein POV27_14610 [Aureisphaera galaxeae]|uniref:hypothetical protein n=1 Tax=Aureisphaera galaxeae TaxID=1538023 RepID=UPI002350656F|nr:hypothetical protein [Aureisphaera galaxeae]MDC8005291.1 hypothetical protein [Aureisphaera galaxeae]
MLSDTKYRLFKWKTGTIRRLILSSLFSLLFFLFSFEASAQVTSSVDTTLIRIGEEIKYTIQVEADTTSLVLFPEGQSFAPLETIESYKTDTTQLESKYLLIKKYGITQFDSGTYKLPAQRVMIDDRVFTTDSAMVEVRDVPVDTLKQKMFDIKPVIEVKGPPFNFIWLLYVLAPLLVIGGVWYFLFRRKKRKEEREKQLPPYEEAMVALQELDNLELLKENKSKAYYSSLTEIVKRYLDREVDSRALESTSDELIERLLLLKDSGHFEFDKETIRKLDAIFKRADLVKFAKMKEESGQARSDRASIEEIINETQEAIPEPSEEELLQNELYLAAMRKKRRNKRVLIGSLAGVLAILITTVVLGSTYGWSYLKDNVIGHPTKELLEGKWYKSEYGIPSIIVETPVILKRTELPIPEELKAQIQSTDAFAYGSVIDQFSIVVNATRFTNPVEVDLEVSLEGSLQTLEQQGAQNIFVKQESFETGEGLKGRKAYGSFNFPMSNGKLAPKQNYEIIAFGQQGALQQIMVVSREDDVYAKQVVERIMNSVELEVDPFQKIKKDKEEE